METLQTALRLTTRTKKKRGEKGALMGPISCRLFAFFLVRRTQADTDGRVLDAENLAKGTI